MAQANYTQVETAIRFHREFRGNSCHGEWQNGEVYRVYSYGTMVAKFDLVTGVKWINPESYSKTTSRLQNIIRRVWA